MSATKPALHVPLTRRSRDAIIQWQTGQQWDAGDMLVALVTHGHTRRPQLAFHRLPREAAEAVRVALGHPTAAERERIRQRALEAIAGHRGGR